MQGEYSEALKNLGYHLEETVGDSILLSQVYWTVDFTELTLTNNYSWLSAHDVVYQY